MLAGIRILIVDDELQSISLIKKLLLDHFPEFLIFEALTVDEALQNIRDNHPQLLFLDVQMRGETGFDLLDKTDITNFEIIFTTAHGEFAIKAFKYSALDYLLKPIDADEFVDAVNKAVLRIKSHQSSSDQINFLKEIKSHRSLPEKLTVPTPEGFLLLNISDILYCQASGNYTELYLSDNKKIISSYTLGHYDEILTNHNFFRVHRSFLVNIEHIKMYKKGAGGTIIMKNGHEIEVSRRNKDAFLQIFNL
jgi:two-component system, LytTR family, response regulator